MHVCVGQENAFVPECAVQRESNVSDSKIPLYVVNMAKASDGYWYFAVDATFLDGIRPHVVHIGHLMSSQPSCTFTTMMRSWTRR